MPHDRTVLERGGGAGVRGSGALKAKRFNRAEHVSKTKNKIVQLHDTDKINFITGAEGGVSFLFCLHPAKLSETSLDEFALFHSRVSTRFTIKHRTEIEKHYNYSTPRRARCK